MAKGASFKRGTSGSPKHTEVTGNMGYDGGHIGDEGPRIGAGVLGKRVTFEYAKKGMSGKTDGVPRVTNMKTYAEGE